MRSILFFVIIVNLSSFPIQAQDKKTTGANPNGCSCGLQSIVQVGLLEGAAGPSWSLQTINGIHYNTWFAGIGVGLDYYSMRTIPLFLEVRKEIFRNKNTPFLYADGGLHFDWLKTKEKPGWGSSDYDQRFYYDAGAGYKFGFGKRSALLMSAGYTMKTLREEWVVTPQCIQPPCDPSRDYYNYTFNRLIFKIGWQFR